MKGDNGKEEKEATKQQRRQAVLDAVRCLRRAARSLEDEVDRLDEEADRLTDSLEQVGSGR